MNEPILKRWLTAQFRNLFILESPHFTASQFLLCCSFSVCFIIDRLRGLWMMVKRGGGGGGVETGCWGMRVSPPAWDLVRSPACFAACRIASAFMLWWSRSSLGCFKMNYYNVMDKKRCSCWLCCDKKSVKTEIKIPTKTPVIWARWAGGGGFVMLLGDL